MTNPDTPSHPATQAGASQAVETEANKPWGKGLPSMGTEVAIRHGRDDDEHLCVVTGYEVWPALREQTSDPFLHRVLVHVVYKGSSIKNCRHLHECHAVTERTVAKWDTGAPFPAPLAATQPNAAPSENLAHSALQKIAALDARNPWAGRIARGALKGIEVSAPNAAPGDGQGDALVDALNLYGDICFARGAGEWPDGEKREVPDHHDHARAFSAVLALAAPSTATAAQEQEQRERMNVRFANRPASAATADFDLPAASDAVAEREREATASKMTTPTTPKLPEPATGEDSSAVAEPVVDLLDAALEDAYEMRISIQTFQALNPRILTPFDYWKGGIEKGRADAQALAGEVERLRSTLDAIRLTYDDGELRERAADALREDDALAAFEPQPIAGPSKQ